MANIDPLYVIYSDPKRKFGRWNLEEFFKTGEKEISELITHVNGLGYPENKNKALDFGCGVGRLTRHISLYFNIVYGVDISPTMITKANELNMSFTNCKFITNDKDYLPFPNDYFDMVYTNVVLMHMPSTDIIKSYISDFIRVLKKDGLIVFQLPHGFSRTYALQPIRRIYTLLRFFGFSSNFIYEKLGLTPIRGECILEEEIKGFLKFKGAEILEIQRNDEKNVKNRIYYVTK